MIKKNALAISLILLVTGTILLWSDSSNLNAELIPEIPNKLDKKTRADLANLQNFEMTKDPELGYVPREQLWEATKQLKGSLIA